jgi:hypothetical protein
LRNFCPKNFSHFNYTPSIGNSGGIITIWNGGLFSGTLISQDTHHVTAEFMCKSSGRKWYLTNIYGPAHNEGIQDFFTWLSELDSSNMNLWMILGDFNLIRAPEDRNRPGGDSNNMMAFNSVIQAHDLEEIPLKGRNYTWSNMQDAPLLEKLDWIFTSPDWTTEFPNTMSFPLARLGSDHTPIHIQIGNNIPKSNLFRFENYWLDFDGFMDVISSKWNNAVYISDSAKQITAKFKDLRYGLKKWSKQLSNLNQTITNCSFTLSMLDGIEE